MWELLLVSLFLCLVLKVRYLFACLHSKGLNTQPGCLFVPKASLNVKEEWKPCAYLSCHPSPHCILFPSHFALTCKEKIFLGCREEKADCAAGSLRFYHLDILMENFNSCSSLRAAVKGRGGRKPVAKLGGGEGGGRQSCHCLSWDWLCWLRWVRLKQVLKNIPPWPFSYFHSVVNFAFSPSPLVQLAETPDEVVVSKEWLAQCNLSLYSFYVKLVRLAALYNFTFPNPVVTVFYGPTCDSDWFCVVWGSWK